MDFRDDPLTWNIGDHFMFGPILLVNPVTESKATERRVYLPKDSIWYDFWSEQKDQAEFSGL
jgi:alpha-D-xyloside xylohydrolase